MPLLLCCFACWAANMQISNENSVGWYLHTSYWSCRVTGSAVWLVYKWGVVLGCIDLIGENSLSPSPCLTSWPLLTSLPIRRWSVMFVGTDDNYAKVPSANDIGGGEGNDNDEASNKESENGKGKETITKEATSVSSDSLAFKYYKYGHLRFLRRWAQFLLAAMQIHILYFLRNSMMTLTAIFFLKAPFYVPLTC